jgi:hypothetical protein
MNKWRTDLRWCRAIRIFCYFALGTGVVAMFHELVAGRFVTSFVNLISCIVLIYSVEYYNRRIWRCKFELGMLRSKSD